MAYDVVVPGRPSCDLVLTSLEAWPALGREVYADGLSVHAGSHANVAVALHRLGLRVALCAVVGADAWGEVVLRELGSEGLDDAYVRVLGAVPTPVSVALNRDGDRGFVTYGPGHDEAEAVYVELARQVPSRHVHADLSAARAIGALEATLSVDAFDAPELGWAREVVAAVDVVFANEAEATAIAGSWRALGDLSRHAVVKRGALGAAAIVDGELVEAPAVPAEVVDATGAGDCFAAGYLWAWLRGEPPEACLEAGNRCGAAAVARPGGFAGAPTEAELLAAVSA